MTAQQLIEQLWEIINKQVDSDLVVTEICVLLNETEVQIEIEKGQQ
jgi:hypothetical protein